MVATVMIIAAPLSIGPKAVFTWITVYVLHAAPQWLAEPPTASEYSWVSASAETTPCRRQWSPIVPSSNAEVSCSTSSLPCKVGATCKVLPVRLYGL
jgi:hypothetical protein